MSDQSTQPENASTRPNKSPLQRRRVRKGTSSCWECKRRKKRCIYPLSSTTICCSCLRLDQPCVPQDYDYGGDSEGSGVEQQLSRIESLVAQLIHQRDTDSSKRMSKSGAPPALGPDEKRAQSKRQALARNSSPISQRLQPARATICDFLKSTLPLPHVARMILNNGRSAFDWAWPQTRTCPISRILLGNTTLTLDSLPLTIQPIVFARKLVELALCLLQPSFKHSRLTVSQLNPDETAKRYIDAARHVTSSDPLVRSIDGLETLLLEALYQVHSGDTDMSLKSFRRAIGIAQSMELHRLPPTADSRIKHLWFRLVYTDRWHALAYGLPSAVIDDKLVVPFDSDSDSPTRRLDVRHIEIAGRIISRNVRLQRMSGDERHAHSTTSVHRKESEMIDGRLKDAMQSLPTEFWVLTSASASIIEEATETTARLIAHIHHSYLIILTHQPWVLAAIHTDNSMPVKTSRTNSDSYSQIASLCAARELLSKFPHVLSFPHLSPSLKGLQHKIHFAATMLLLIHLHHARYPEWDVSGHQRPYDLHLITQALARVGGLYEYGNTVPQGDVLETLETLIGLVQGAANGLYYSIYSDWCGRGEVDGDCDDPTAMITVSYPYFGRVRVIQEFPR